MHVTRTRRAALATAALFVTTFVGSLAIGAPSAFGAVTDAGTSTVVASSPSVTADGTTDTVTVTLLDGASSPVAGDTVTLTPSGGTSSQISAASGPSNAGGVVTFTVSDTVAEDVTYTAHDTTAAVGITQTAHVSFTAGPADAGESTVSASPTTVTANGVAHSTITVTLLDANDNPVAGDTVYLSPDAGHSQYSDPSISNASGVSTFTVTDTAAETVTYTAIDSTTALHITQTAAVTFVAGPVDATVSSVTASPTSVPADGTTQSTITVTVLDGQYNPVAGHTVTLAPNFGNSVISAASGPSNANGVVTFTVTDATAEEITYAATDTTAAVAIVETAPVFFTGPADAGKSTVVATPTTVTANGTSTSTVTVTCATSIRIRSPVTPSPWRRAVEAPSFRRRADPRMPMVSSRSPSATPWRRASRTRHTTLRCLWSSPRPLQSTSPPYRRRLRPVATGSWQPTAASSPTVTQASSAPRAPHT